MMLHLEVPENFWQYNWPEKMHIILQLLIRTEERQREWENIKNQEI